MVIVKVIRHSGEVSRYLQSMVHYVTDERAIGSGASGLSLSSPAMAYEQMLAVKQYYNQMSTNPLVHLVVSLDGVYNNENAAVQIAPQIASYFANSYQLMYCVHSPDADFKHHYHIHILLHSVNIQNGHLFHSGPYEIKGFAFHVSKITHDDFQICYERIEDKVGIVSTND